MDKNRPPEDLLTAFLDNECTESERAEVEKILFEDMELRQLYENMRALRSFLRTDLSDAPGFRPVNLSEMGFSPAPASEPIPALGNAPMSSLSPAGVQMDKETFEKLLQERDALLAGSRRSILLTAGIAGIAGVFAALLLGGFLFTQMLGRFQPPVSRVVTSQPSDTLVLDSPVKPPITAPVMVKNPVQEPAPELEALATEVSSCIIEIINAADDINTAVFQIPDTDGELITVVWLTGLDMENSI